MSDVVLTEQLDQAIEALLRNPDAPLPATDPQVAELLGIALELRALPRAGFKARLKNELGKEASMSIALEEETESRDNSPQSVNDSTRAVFRTVTPYLTVPDVHEEIEFVTKVFGAEGRVYGLGSAGGFHSEYRIGDSMVMIGGGGKGAKWKGTPTPGALHLYVEDVDAVYERAMQAGATVLMPPTDLPYGERGAGIQDVGGNHWYIATSNGPQYIPEGLPNLMPFFNPRGAPKMIEFLKESFGAEEVAVHKSPEGIVHHAQIRIGDSIVEMGEAHGEWQPRPMTFMLYVDDVDAWYGRAMKAEGAISLSDPADKAYGDRVGAVKDPFDNVWYIGAHIQAKK
jgi:PhnB protein